MYLYPSRLQPRFLTVSLAEQQRGRSRFCQLGMSDTLPSCEGNRADKAATISRFAGTPPSLEILCSAFQKLLAGSGIQGRSAPTRVHCLDWQRVETYCR